MTKTPNKKLYEEIDLFEQETKKIKEDIVNKIVLKALYSLKLPQPILHCSRKIDLTKLNNYSEKMLGQVLGKNGKHKKEFVNLTGVNLEIDKDSGECIILSKYNTVDVEKAYMLITRLLKKNSWSTDTLSTAYEAVKTDFKNICITKGKDILENYLKYEKVSDYLAEVVGLLRYSYSFNQNILDHSLEVAQLSANIAAQIGLDPLMAKRAGFFHDVGKSIANYEDHVVVGLKIAKKENLDKYIQNTIESHHGKVKPNNPYAIIAKAMDKVSAGRIGSRPMQNELIEKRKTMMNDELMKLDWIEKVVLKNAGNLIHIFVRLKKFNYERIQEMKDEVRLALKNISDQYIYNYQIELKLFYNEAFMLNENKKIDIDSNIPREIQKAQFRNSLETGEDKFDEFDYVKYTTANEKPEEVSSPKEVIKALEHKASQETQPKHKWSNKEHNKKQHNANQNNKQTPTPQPSKPVNLDVLKDPNRFDPFEREPIKLEVPVKEQFPKKFEPQKPHIHKNPNNNNNQINKKKPAPLKYIPPKPNVVRSETRHQSVDVLPISTGLENNEILVNKQQPDQLQNQPNLSDKPQKQKAKRKPINKPKKAPIEGSSNPTTKGKPPMRKPRKKAENKPEGQTRVGPLTD